MILDIIHLNYDNAKHIAIPQIVHVVTQITHNTRQTLNAPKHRKTISIMNNGSAVCFSSPQVDTTTIPQMSTPNCAKPNIPWSTTSQSCFQECIPKVSLSSFVLWVKQTRRMVVKFKMTERTVCAQVSELITYVHTDNEVPGYLDA